MSAKRSVRRRIDGVLLLDKPSGITSQGAVSRAKALFGAAKVGHTGTLDPMATGLLPLAFGEATKFSHSLLEADKAYLAEVRFGVTTTTGDLEGEVLETRPVDFDRTRLEAALEQFKGPITQVPPMYSALKHQGKALYEYARAGTEIERAARAVTIHALGLESFDGTHARLRVECSKGTYIRVLAEDLGRTLGCGATLAALRRTRVGAFSIEDSVALDVLHALSEDERSSRLLPADALVCSLPEIALAADDARRLGMGQSVRATGGAPGLVRVYGAGEVFLGVGELSADGELAPKRLVSSAGASP